MTRLATLIGTVGGVGHLRPAPGTWGSLAALPLALVLHWWGGFPLLAAASVVAFFAGWWATAMMTRDQTDKDPSHVVIDEVAGQWIALWAISAPTWNMGIEITRLWPGWIAAFVLFRVFDILKPGPVGRADRRGDPLGVMLDDVIAGVFAALGTFVLGALWHVVIL